MPAILESAVPQPPHLQLSTTSPWPPYNSHCYGSSASSPTPMTPESLTAFVPRLHDSPLPSQEAPPSSTWFGASASVPDAQNETFSAFPYSQPFVPSHPSSAGPYSPQHQFSQPSDIPSSVEHPAGNFSPVSQCSRGSEGPHPEYVRQSQEPSPDASTNLSGGLTPSRPRSTPLDYSPWTMDPLNMAGSAMHQHYYPSPSYPSMRDRSPRLSEPGMELVSDLSNGRRLYAPIAPHPTGPRTSAPKRSHEDVGDHLEQTKRRKRSDSNTSTTIELGEEDRLLIQLKDEESMPWKDIAARFQSDLGKTYQIPALQMRLKRLRERMRVWTEPDIKALRMAHEYWAQSKFDIIAQKMLEFGAAEKWTARQCARKWAEIDPGPTPYTTYEHHMPTYATYTMSPAEPHPFMSYVHIQ
ncbi:hypothetical protein BU23DRAFT_541840 [Bimuria novae-zelandiae CBS 107.79]|uniref:Myb-like domain-containing protein n=1 Tax=Bimuria novae-zelandiae CBS 107.79 TaxID=1447943 RepID=A0A6A5US68_9PLEO|nr:hypothetical protein BU23DRAFT_541840 [Bimuria novae-zelandiae CBS 107.79]